MEWNKPDRGATRIIKKFALFPKCLGGQFKWLQMCYIEQRYCWGSGFLDNDYWDDVEFVTEEKYLKEKEEKMGDKKSEIAYGSVDVKNLAAKKIESLLTEPAEIKEEEEWIWVEGYKATDKDMRCREYQYELGKQFDMPEGAEIKECESGFHLCLTLRDVFNYYNIGGGNRFFKVRALVRKSDKDKYGCSMGYFVNAGGLLVPTSNKLAAKSIIFLSELTRDEILETTELKGYKDEYKDLAIQCDIETAKTAYRIASLVEDGYSETFANYLVSNKLFDKAHAIGTCKDCSMDMKVLFIMNK